MNNTLYTSHGDTCIHQSTNQMSWNNSRNYCQSISGDLVKVENNDLNKFLVSLGQGDAWIGLGRHPSNLSRFFWTDGTEVI